jgi:cysteine synthase
MGSDGAIIAAPDLAQSDPKPNFYAEQSGGSITHFVGRLGSSGTFTGIAHRLRNELPKPASRLIKVHAAIAASGLGSLKQ